jgi:DNA-binding NarL/FixJ family response regulator
METILIVDDHRHARQAIRSVLEELFPEAAIMEAATLTEARQLMPGSQFCLAMIDLNLPDGSGIDLLRELSSTSPNTYLITTTIFDDNQHIFDALRAGTQGYMLKDMSLNEMTLQLKGMLNGQPPLSPSIARRILQHFRESTGHQVNRPMHNLTDREQTILTLIAKGLTKTEAAKKLNISAHTVSDHIRNIYQKLNINTRAEAALEAHRLGLVDGL